MFFAVGANNLLDQYLSRKEEPYSQKVGMEKRKLGIGKHPL